MSNFKYVGKKLFVEKLSAVNVAKKNLTPFYLYSAEQIKENYLSFTKIFKSVKPLICYAAKANSI